MALRRLINFFDTEPIGTQNALIQFPRRVVIGHTATECKSQIRGIDAAGMPLINAEKMLRHKGVGGFLERFADRALNDRNGPRVDSKTNQRLVPAPPPPINIFHSAQLLQPR